MASLQEQCAALGLPLRRQALAREAAGWVAAGRCHSRPEAAALSLLEADGWIGAACEGGPMLLLMKAACLRRLQELNRLGPADSLTRFLEAQLVINAAHLDSIAEAVGNASASEVTASFVAIYAAGVDRYYPGVSADLILQLHQALGGRVVEIFKRFAGDTYAYRAGWPDITAVRDGELLLREVKTTDRLHRSQIETFDAVLKPSALPTDVVQIVPLRVGAG